MNDGPAADQLPPAIRHAVPPRRPTMVDVARAAGVSVKTVSRVVNGAPHVQQQVIDKWAKSRAGIEEE